MLCIVWKHCVLIANFEWMETNKYWSVFGANWNGIKSQQTTSVSMQWIHMRCTSRSTNKQIRQQTKNICNEKQHDYINVRSFSKFYLLRHTKRFVKWFVLICTRCHAWSDVTIEPKNRILISTCKWKCTHWTSASIATMHFLRLILTLPMFPSWIECFLLSTRCCSFIWFSNRRRNVNMRCFVCSEQSNSLDFLNGG